MRFNCKGRLQWLGNYALIGLFWVSMAAHGQDVKTYNFPGASCYSNTLFIQKAETPKGVIVLDVGHRDIEDYANNNPLVSSAKFGDYNFLYIKILEERSRNSTSCFETITDVISKVYHVDKKAFFLLKEADVETIEKNDLDHEEPNSLKILEVPFDDMDELKYRLDDLTTGKKYLLPKEWSKDQIDSTKMNNYKGNLDMGFHYSPTVLLGNKFGIKSNFMGMYSSSLKFNTSGNSALVLNLNYSKTNKTKIQEEITSAGKKDTINSHFLLGADLLYRKYMPHKEDVRFFCSAGLGFYTIMDIDLKKRSTSLYVKNYESQYITPLLEGGVEYRITPVIGINGLLPLRYFISTKDRELNTFSIGLTVGIVFTLNTNRVLKTMKE